MKRISSKKSYDSALTYDESNTEENLNNALLISTDEKVLSNSVDEIFDGTNGSHSVSKNVDVDRHLSDIFEYTDSTKLISFSCTKSNSNKNDKHVNDSVQNLNNLQYQQDTNAEEENHETNKYVPLRVRLRRMFDEILGKYNNPVKESNATCSSRNSVNECSLNNSNLLITKVDNTHETHNNDSLQLVQKPNYTVIMSIKNIKDSGNTKVLSSHDTSMSFLSGFVPNNLVTILENSNEDTSNSEIYRSFDWSKTYIGKLPKLSPENVMGKYCTSKTIFTTSDINDSETSLSSNISNDIEVISKEIFQKANSLQSNNLLNFVSQIEKIDNGNNVNNED